MRDDVGPSGRRLEHLRYWAFVSLVLLALASFVFGLIGIILSAWLIGGLFAFGFELSRPVAKTDKRDKLWTVGVRILLLSFIPVAILVVIMDNRAGAVADEVQATLPWHYRLVLASLFGSAIGSMLAAFHILRQRGPPKSIQWHLRSTPIVLLGLVLVYALPMWALPPFIVFLPPAMFLGHALFRILRPVERVLKAPAVPLPAAIAPTFTPFRGSR